jgi:hypothetical protein
MLWAGEHSGMDFVLDERGTAQTKFQGGAANGADRPDEKVIITRFQYSL